MTAYWIVGAMFGGSDDCLSSFEERGYWYCWDNNIDIDESSFSGGNSVLAQRERFKKIKLGDRIAVKKSLIGDGMIAVRAIGIVKDVDLSEWRVYVDWVLKEKDIGNRLVPISGWTASIHGPYSAEDRYIKDIFIL